jgi:flagellar motility protein MotE (MotC chaperone)
MNAWLRFKLLPVTIAACGLMMVVKMIGLSQGRDHLEEILASPAIAEEKKPEDKSGDKPAEKSAKKPAEKSEDEKSTDKAGDAKDAKKDDAKQDSTKEPAKESTSKAEPSPQALAEKCQFNQIEVDLLENLSARREEIEKWADEVKMQESVLKATEVQMDQKIVQMQALKNEVQELLKKYDTKADIDLRSLVKIYENMKPKDAARIFDEMEMEIMLDVVDLMSERKVAPIFANMNPIKAKDLTIDLAERRRMRRETNEKIMQQDVPPVAASPDAAATTSPAAPPATPATPPSTPPQAGG